MRKRILESVASVFAWTSLVFVMSIHVLYLVTLKDEPFMTLIEPLRGTPMMAVALCCQMMQAPVSAVGLFVLGLLLGQKVQTPSRFGVLAGLLVGLWFNAQFLLLPYLGGYLNLPAILLGSVLTGWQNKGPIYWLTPLIVNLIVWPFGIWLWMRCWEVFFLADGIKDHSTG